MDPEELGPVVELEQWFQHQSGHGLLFYLVEGSREGASGAVRLELAMTEGGATFVVICPCLQTEPYLVRTESASLKPWVEKLASFARQNAGTIKLAGLLAQAVLLHKESPASSSAASSSTAPAPRARNNPSPADSDLGDEVTDEDEETSDAMEEEEEDDGAFTTDWDIKMDLRKKAWRAKEVELRKEWDREKRALSTTSANANPNAMQPSDYDQAEFIFDEEAAYTARPSQQSATTATKEGQQIFSHESAAFQILSNELIGLLKNGPGMGLICDSVNDSLYTWSVHISDFKEEPLASQMRALKGRWGYDYVELQLDFVPDFPFYPPMLRLLRPRFNGSLVQSLANSDLLKLTYWNPTTKIQAVLLQIKEILHQHAKVNVDSERNDRDAFPNGAYAQVEDDLIKLALATEIRPRANFAILDVENLEKAPQFRLAKEEEEDMAKRACKGKGKGLGGGGGWARGTGYGSGLMRSNWDPDALLKAQAEKERQILKILRSLLAHLRPEASLSGSEQEEIYSILEASALIPFLEAELMQPSFIEIGQHTEKYSLILELISALEERSFLLPLLGPLANQAPGNSVMRLLSALAETAREYLEAMARSLQTLPTASGNNSANKPASYLANIIHKRKAKAETKASAAKRREASDSASSSTQASSRSEAEEDDDETLESLRQEDDDPERRNARVIVAVHARLSRALAEAGISWRGGEGEEDVTMEDPEAPGPSGARQSLEARYKRAIKPLQYDNYTAVCEAGAPWAHKFGVKRAKAAGGAGSGELGPKEVRRIFKEFTALRSSLPLDLASAVAVRVDEAKVHLLRALILGPEGTPYAHGAFLFDVAFPAGYPASPPEVNIITTGSGSVRFNPNLYDNGKVCLSLLGTWSGAKGEQWNPATSTLLQVLVSIQSLIMVEQPYFNEPGYEATMGTTEGDNRSKEYNKNIRAGTVKWAMLEQLKNPPPGFKTLIQTHFRLKRERLLEEVSTWEEEDPNNRQLRNSFKALKDELAKLA